MDGTGPYIWDPIAGTELVRLVGKARYHPSHLVFLTMFMEYSKYFMVIHTKWHG